VRPALDFERGIALSGFYGECRWIDAERFEHCANRRELLTLIAEQPHG
jgi:hypothetical protein